MSQAPPLDLNAATATPAGRLLAPMPHAHPWDAVATFALPAVVPSIHAAFGPAPVKHALVVLARAKAAGLTWVVAVARTCRFVALTHVPRALVPLKLVQPPLSRLATLIIVRPRVPGQVRPGHGVAT